MKPRCGVNLRILVEEREESGSGIKELKAKINVLCAGRMVFAILKRAVVC